MDLNVKHKMKFERRNTGEYQDLGLGKELLDLTLKA